MSTSSATASSSPSTPPQRSEKSGSTNSNLYLVTFLATLFLLLFVSCGIVLRSYILRRRYQRQIRFALANGAVLAPRAQGSRRKKLGMRPRLYDAWIAPLYVGGYGLSSQNPNLTSDEKGDGADIGEKQGTSSWAGFSQGRWCDMMPVTVQTVIVKRRTKDPSAILPTSPSTATYLTASPPSGFPSPDVGASSSARPMLPPVAPPSNFIASSPTEYTPDDNQIRPFDLAQSTSRRMSVQFADQPRRSFFSFPHHFHTRGERSDSQRPRRNSALSIFPAASSDGQSNRQRRNSTGGALHTRERTESATWRTIVSPNPSLPMPPTPNTANEYDDDDGWTHQDNGNRGRLRSAVGRWLPVPRLNTTDLNAETAPTSPSTPVVGNPEAAPSKHRVRTEMLQVSVLVAMPSLKTSRLYGDANLVKNGYGSYPSQLASVGTDIKKTRRRSRSSRKDGKNAKGDLNRHSIESADTEEIIEIPGENVYDEESGSESESEEMKGEEEPDPLPELVLGVTRLSYRPWSRVTTELTEPTAGSPS